LRVSDNPVHKNELVTAARNPLSNINRNVNRVHVYLCEWLSAITARLSSRINYALKSRQQQQQKSALRNQRRRRCRHVCVRGRNCLPPRPVPQLSQPGHRHRVCLRSPPPRIYLCGQDRVVDGHWLGATATGKAAQDPDQRVRGPVQRHLQSVPREQRRREGRVQHVARGGQEAANLCHHADISKVRAGMEGEYFCSPSV
jgi:hypothetical protein